MRGRRFRARRHLLLLLLAIEAGIVVLLVLVDANQGLLGLLDFLNTVEIQSGAALNDYMIKRLPVILDGYLV